MKLNICTWAFQLLKVSIVLHNQAFHQIYGRIGIERFPKKFGVVCHGCVSQRHGPPPNLLTRTRILLSKYGAAHPSWFLFNCALPKLYKFTRFLDLRAFAGFCGRFADFCVRFAGNFGRKLCAFICVGARDMNAACSGYENGLVCPWDAARMQAMFSHIQNVNCGDSVATRKQNQAN